MRKRRRFGHCRVFYQQELIKEETKEEKKESIAGCRDDLETLAVNISLILPQKNCGMCGYEGCYELAKAIAKGEEAPDACRVAGREVASTIESLLKLERMCSEVSGFLSE